MADKKVKAWAVVGGGHRFCPVADIRNTRDGARFIAGCRGEGAKAVPCTITLHMPKKKAAAQAARERGGVG